LARATAARPGREYSPPVVLNFFKFRTPLHHDRMPPSLGLAAPGVARGALWRHRRDGGTPTVRGARRRTGGPRQSGKAELRSLTNGLPSRTNVCTRRKRPCGPPRRRAGFSLWLYCLLLLKFLGKAAARHSRSVCMSADFPYLVAYGQAYDIHLFDHLRLRRHAQRTQGPP
jgi:hypothetical protein